MIPSLILKNSIIPFFLHTPTNGPPQGLPNDGKETRKVPNPPTFDQLAEVLWKYPGNMKTKKEKMSHLRSHWTKHKEVINRFFLPQTDDTSISQVPKYWQNITL